MTTVSIDVSLEERTKLASIILKDLHSVFDPHIGQIPIGSALFYKNKQFVFLECGRKFGKSELIIYALYRQCMMNPGSATYYIAPFQKQAKELIWANKRIQHFLVNKHTNSNKLVHKYLDGEPNNTEMRVWFKNGSFIKLDGADNYEAYRGINPHFIAYDEFKDHHPEFHVGMEPNLGTHKAPCLIVGTPPESETNHFCTIADSIKNDKEDGAYFNMPTHMNPHIDKKWLEKTRARLIARGEYDVWLREYEAKRVKGGRNHIIPMFDRKKHVVQYADTLADVKRFYRDYDLFCTADPGSASTFAVLFTAIHRYTRRVRHLTCIYEKELGQTSARKMWDKILPKLREIHPNLDYWHFTYDEAATWFSNEIMDITGGTVYFVPTRKSLHKKEEGLSLIKDQILAGLWECTDQCDPLATEVENYVRDKEGRIPKEHDHLIDCARYTNAAANYSHIPSEKAVEVDDIRRYHTIESDLLDSVSDTDWTRQALGETYYDYFDVGGF